MKPEVLTIIPARGGSKGIPRKNVRLIAGKPLLAYSIEHARAASSVTRIAVSTDDKEIAAVAESCGASVIWRPPDISGDAATSESALVHALDDLARQEKYEPSLVVFLQATSPLRQPGDIQNAIDIFEKEKADSLFSACLVHGFVWRKQGDDLSSFSYDYRNRQRRQDAPEDLVENGSIYIFKPWVLRKFNNRLGGKISVYRMNPLDSFQVDEPEDLRLMEELLAIRRATGTRPDLRKIRLLVLDFDGVMTDNRVWITQDGAESVVCNRSDGWGIARLKQAGVEILVLSTEKIPVAAARCRKLQIESILGCDDKLSRLKQLAQERSLASDQIAYVGNDVNDLACMQWVGAPIAVADALPEVKRAARFVTEQAGGFGAVREVCDLFLAQRQEFNRD